AVTNATRTATPAASRRPPTASSCWRRPSRPVHEPVRVPLGAALDRDRVRALVGAVGLGADESHARSRAALSSAPRLVGAERAADGAVVVGFWQFREVLDLGYFGFLAVLSEP